jgi:hypothetical protein
LLIRDGRGRNREREGEIVREGLGGREAEKEKERGKEREKRGLDNHSLLFSHPHSYQISMVSQRCWLLCTRTMRTVSEF